MSRALDHLSTKQKQLAPCLVMVDPFGVSGTPMSVIERILRNPRSEVYVSFMYESINRFRKDPTFARRLDELFGSEDWRKGVDIEDGKQRKTFFYSLYEAHSEEPEPTKCFILIFIGAAGLSTASFLELSIRRAAT